MCVGGAWGAQSGSWAMELKMTLERAELGEIESELESQLSLLQLEFRTAARMMV